MHEFLYSRCKHALQDRPPLATSERSRTRRWSPPKGGIGKALFQVSRDAVIRFTSTYQTWLILASCSIAVLHIMLFPLFPLASAGHCACSDSLACLFCCVPVKDCPPDARMPANSRACIHVRVALLRGAWEGQSLKMSQTDGIVGSKLKG